MCRNFQERNKFVRGLEFAGWCSRCAVICGKRNKIVRVSDWLDGAIDVQ